MWSIAARVHSLMSSARNVRNVTLPSASLVKAIKTFARFVVVENISAGVDAKRIVVAMVTQELVPTRLDWLPIGSSHRPSIQIPREESWRCSWTKIGFQCVLMALASKLLPWYATSSASVTQ